MDPKPSARLPDQGRVDCNCLVNLGGFCGQIRAITGMEGITPSMVLTRTAKEAASGTTTNGRNWVVRKIQKLKSEVMPELKAQNGALVPESGASASAQSSDSEGVVSPNTTTIPASQLEGLLSMEFNSNWNGQSPNCSMNDCNLDLGLNVICKGKRKRSSRSK